jgi:hypothetical protein
MTTEDEDTTKKTTEVPREPTVMKEIKMMEEQPSNLSSSEASKTEFGHSPTLVATEGSHPGKATDVTQPKVEEKLETYTPSQSVDSSPTSVDPNPFFHFMARYPLPFLVVLPIVFAILIGFGWTKEDMVENDISNLWVAEDSDYARDNEYQRSLGARSTSSSSFAAMAISRDGRNILTDDRLEEVRSRMEAAEKLTVSTFNHCTLHIGMFPSH